MFWFFVADQLGQALGQPLDAIDQFRRARKQCAKPARGGRNHRAALRPDLGQSLGTAHRAAELNFGRRRKADRLDLRRRALEYRRYVVDFDPHPDEFGPVGK